MWFEKDNKPVEAVVGWSFLAPRGVMYPVKR
jgi:hypothetical protein